MVSVTLDKLALGKPAIISQIPDNDLGNKLLEMGVLPGEFIRVVKRTGVGKTALIEVGYSRIGLRNDACKEVIVEIKHDGE